ncbi:MAG: glycosyltransferase [Bacteroidales bacterium]|nr:glycosyltransferase [Bacteroidales bacterium]
MIKIIHLITSINLGGAEIVAFNLANQNSKKFEYIIVELFKSNNSFAESKRKELNIRFYTLFKRSKRISLIISPFKLFYLIIKEKPKIIHSHTDLPDFVLAITLRLIKFFNLPHPKIVRTIHNTELWASHNRIGKFVESSLNNDYIVAVSEASSIAYVRLRTKYNLPISKNIQVIYNGCKTPKHLSLGIKLESNKLNIAFCGRFEYQKGIDILIEKISYINLKYQNKINFYFIGEGSYKKQIDDLANAYDNIKVSPPIIGISNKLHAFDYLIMPSRFEGLGLISVESSLAKTPVIATKIQGLSETLPVEWPLYFSLNNESSLLNIFDKIVNIREYELNQIKEDAYLFTSSRFSFEKFLNSYYDIYSTFTGKK